MLAGGYSWRLFFYVETAFAGALFVLAFFFVEETSYKRHITLTPVHPSPTTSQIGEKSDGAAQVEEAVPLRPVRKTFLQTLKPFNGIDHEAEFFMTMVRPFTYFTVPAVFWVITTYGAFSLS